MQKYQVKFLDGPKKDSIQILEMPYDYSVDAVDTGLFAFETSENRIVRLPLKFKILQKIKEKRN